jgi:hypothetical protein
MATATEYNILRKMTSDYLDNFSRMLEPDDKEGEVDRQRVLQICREQIDNPFFDNENIDYEAIRIELCVIRNRYKYRLYHKKIRDMRKKAKEECENKSWER